ncbi:hypothetical protein [Polluticoccus soli]|uniref:hypothetical protein n=1 Tax=Polluticoccus soli TaxID=3034150 RepID=UPI0023E1E1E0|nr:hypothetical protein [Flavipsychrobacter sp. JY13-12]
MATVIVNHKVKDYATWKQVFDADEERRQAAGLKLMAVGQKSGEPNNVYIVFSMTDPSTLPSFMGSAELQEIMKKGGVMGMPEAVVVE